MIITCLVNSNWPTSWLPGLWLWMKCNFHVVEFVILEGWLLLDSNILSPVQLRVVQVKQLKQPQSVKIKNFVSVFGIGFISKLKCFSSNISKCLSIVTAFFIVNISMKIHAINRSHKCYKCKAYIWYWLRIFTGNVFVVVYCDNKGKHICNKLIKDPTLFDYLGWMNQN